MGPGYAMGSFALARDVYVYARSPRGSAFVEDGRLSESQPMSIPHSALVHWKRVRKR